LSDPIILEHLSVALIAVEFKVIIVFVWSEHVHSIWLGARSSERRVESRVDLEVYFFESLKVGLSKE